MSAALPSFLHARDGRAAYTASVFGRSAHCRLRVLAARCSRWLRGAGAASGRDRAPGHPRERTVRRLISVWETRAGAIRQPRGRWGSGRAVADAGSPFPRCSAPGANHIRCSRCRRSSAEPGRMGRRRRADRQTIERHAKLVRFPGRNRRTRRLSSSIDPGHTNSRRCPRRRGRSPGLTSRSDREAVERYRETFRGLPDGSISGGYGPVRHERHRRPHLGARAAIRRRLVAPADRWNP